MLPWSNLDEKGGSLRGAPRHSQRVEVAEQPEVRWTSGAPSQGAPSRGHFGARMACSYLEQNCETELEVESFFRQVDSISTLEFKFKTFYNSMPEIVCSLSNIRRCFVLEVIPCLLTH